MAQYIDKSAIVEEINRRIKEHHSGYLVCLKDILSLLNTLEVKEVNLEKELDEWMRYGPHTNYPWCTIPDAIKITAEHFFKLGLKTQKGE